MCTFAARYHGEHWLGCPLLVSHEAESDACKCAALSHEVSERSLQLHPVQASPALPVLRCAESVSRLLQVCGLLGGCNGIVNTVRLPSDLPRLSDLT